MCYKTKENDGTIMFASASSSSPRCIFLLLLLYAFE